MRPTAGGPGVLQSPNYCDWYCT